MSAAAPGPVLTLDDATVRRARTLARQAGAPVVELARSHTTVSVERATLRLAGLAGADPERLPWVNHLVDAVRPDLVLRGPGPARTGHGDPRHRHRRRPPAAIPTADIPLTDPNPMIPHDNPPELHRSSFPQVRAWLTGPPGGLGWLWPSRCPHGRRSGTVPDHASVGPSRRVPRHTVHRRAGGTDAPGPHAP